MKESPKFKINVSNNTCIRLLDYRAIESKKPTPDKQEANGQIIYLNTYCCNCKL